MPELKPKPTLSVVIPCYNERENLEPLLERLLPLLERLTQGAFEIIFVDDGSRDDSPELLDAFHERDRRVKVLHLSRNFGHQAALSAGMEAASGAAVAMMDADLQDPPEVLEAFVGKWREGYDVVYAIRQNRKESLPLRLAYRIFYRSMRMMAEVDVPLDAGDFCLVDRRVVEVLICLPERQRFLRGLRAWAGFRQTGVPYERQARNAGDPKYTLGKLVRLALSGYVGFSTVPLRLATWLGFSAAGLGFLMAVWAVGTKLMGIPSPRGWSSTIAIMLFIGGIQLLMLGILGEYIGRIYAEVRRRPSYIVRSWVGFAWSAPTRERRDLQQRAGG